MQINFIRFFILFIFLIAEIIFVKLFSGNSICFLFIMISLITLYIPLLISTGFLFIISFFFDILVFRPFGVTFLQLIIIHIAVFYFQNIFKYKTLRSIKYLLTIFLVAESVEIICSTLYSVNFTSHFVNIFCSLSIFEALDFFFKKDHYARG